MPKQYNIKWRIEDEKELRRVARNFNDKLRRLVSANPQNKNILPQFYNERTGEFESQIINYIHVGNHQLGLLLNFGTTSLEYKFFPNRPNYRR